MLTDLDGPQAPIRDVPQRSSRATPSAATNRPTLSTISAKAKCAMPSFTRLPEVQLDFRSFDAIASTKA